MFLTYKESRNRKIKRDVKMKKQRKSALNDSNQDDVDLIPLNDGALPKIITLKKYGVFFRDHEKTVNRKVIDHDKTIYREPYKGWEWYHRGCCLPIFSRKQKRLADNKGKNKGKSGWYGGESNMNSYIARVDCYNHDHDFFLVNNYKNNSPKEPDPNKPICVVCYVNNSGRGKFFFKKCQHGNDLCGACAKQLFSCPVCRSER